VKKYIVHLIKDINMNAQELLLDPLKSWKRVILVFFGFSIFLGLLQYLLLQYWQYNQNLLNYFVFKADSITITSLYLSNFINKNWDNFLFNILVMWIGLYLIFISEKQKNIFWKNIFFILIISPFILPLLSIPILSLIPGSGLTGYSGIACLFLGYGFYSISKYLLELWIISPNRTKIGKNKLYTIIIIFVLLPIVSFVFLADPIEIPLIVKYGLINGIVQTFYQTKINSYIHVIAYILGLAAAFITHKLKM